MNRKGAKFLCPVLGEAVNDLPMQWFGLAWTKARVCLSGFPSGVPRRPANASANQTYRQTPTGAFAVIFKPRFRYFLDTHVASKGLKLNQRHACHIVETDSTTTKGTRGKPRQIETGKANLICDRTIFLFRCWLAGLWLGLGFAQANWRRVELTGKA